MTETMTEALLDKLEPTLESEAGYPHEQFDDGYLSSLDFIETPDDDSPSDNPELSRTNQILGLKIEYINSPSFTKPGAADRIFDSSCFNSDKNISLPKAPAGTPLYLKALYEIPLLSREQEQHLFRKMNFLKYSADQLRKNLDPQKPQTAVLDQIEKLLDDALKVRNQIVRANLRLVISIAKKVVDHANGFEETVSDGNVPLIRAAEIFDFDRGTRFSTYATWAIRNSLYRSTPRNRRYQKRYVTSSEGAFDSAPESRSVEQVQLSRQNELNLMVKSILDKLDNRDRKIVMSRFGMNDEAKPRKFREIAEGLEISTERVRQLLARSIGRMKKFPELHATEFD